MCAPGEEHFEVDFLRNGMSMPGFSKEWGLHAMLGFLRWRNYPVLGPWWGFASQRGDSKGISRLTKIKAAPELFLVGC